jgi:hypothetical protein
MKEAKRHARRNTEPELAGIPKRIAASGVVARDISLLDAIDRNGEQRFGANTPNGRGSCRKTGQDLAIELLTEAALRCSKTQ